MQISLCIFIFLSQYATILKGDDAMPYLFVHFKEKLTPDGEQVYFAKSKDGYYWNEVNDGNPVLSAHVSVVVVMSRLSDLKTMAL